MTSYISHTSVDCRNAYELSEWWKALLGYEDIPGDPNLPGHEECMIRDPATGHQVLFIEVPEPKAVKNRLHLDLQVGGGREVPLTERKPRSFVSIVRHRLRRSYHAISGATILCIIVLAAVFAPLVAPFDPQARVGSLSSVPPGPSSEFWFGLDEQGRDLFSRIIYGTRIALIVGIQELANYLLLPHIEASGQMAVIAGAMRSSDVPRGPSRGPSTSACW